MSALRRLMLAAQAHGIPVPDIQAIPAEDGGTFQITKAPSLSAGKEPALHIAAAPHTKLIPPLRLIAREMEEVNDALVAAFERDAPFMKEGARAILSSGGKRIRPGLALLSARLFSEPVGHPAITCAAAIEMIHTASLLHDDVIDNAVTRRGRAATHVAWNNKASVLLGDFLLARALRELTKSDSIDLFREVAEATADMTCGQILELRHEANFAITLDEYISVVRNKTAALFSLACRCAALLHEASPAQSSALSGFGEKLGIAYQITDDCLDYWGSEEKLGKPVGTDLAEKKLTLPFIYMYGEARENERARIREIVQRERIPPADFDIILSHMETYGARKAALALADEYFAGAEDHLSVLPDSEARAALGDLVHYLRDRER